MVGCNVLLVEEMKIDWLSKLLETKFFLVCDDHQRDRNVFCIDCGRGCCKNCMVAFHGRHRHLQICKYVYQDVVRHQDIQKHLDCSRIQTYKINGEKAVHLNPRPKLKDAKPSTKSKSGACCVACRRYLQDHPNMFCSIACKVLNIGSTKAKGERESMNNNNNIIIAVEKYQAIGRTSTIEEGEISQSSHEQVGSEESQAAHAYAKHLKPIKKNSNKRKGTPRRASLM